MQKKSLKTHQKPLTSGRKTQKKSNKKKQKKKQKKNTTKQKK